MTRVRASGDKWNVNWRACGCKDVALTYIKLVSDHVQFFFHSGDVGVGDVRPIQVCRDAMIILELDVALKQLPASLQFVKY